MDLSGEPLGSHNLARTKLIGLRSERVQKNTLKAITEIPDRGPGSAAFYPSKKRTIISLNPLKATSTRKGCHKHPGEARETIPMLKLQGQLTWIGIVFFVEIG